ncbi:potassium channel [Curvularia clavata]|uniref:Potassium channel n=1 Tax=Curvularia clavata TaxID=95742 RepID=A0A9Q8ZFG8_CURCL|nr:potassium channel [Curvularia clavata]
MNDPGLDEPAQEAAHDVENTMQAEDEQAEREQRQYLDPSYVPHRWWFASTASPLIAGTFGPIANGMSICALVEKWRVYIPPGSDEAHGTKIEDPRWLIAVNSVSLVFALCANISLLLNMSRRLKFAIAQPITIIGFYMAGFLLMALVGVASSSAFRIQPMERHALSQAFYYAIMAAGVYFIIASLMAFTALGAYKGHYDREFRLTASQRTLMLQTIAFMGYLLVGALIFSYVENWMFLDAVFWANFTLLTMGFGGEFVPKTHTGRSLLIPYAIGGLVTVGLVIGSIRSLVLEHGKQKMTARFTEVKRQKVLEPIDEETKTIRISPFEKLTFCSKGLSESQRREQEFRVMRRVQELSERKRRYTALALSTTAALTLWFMGALVFWYSEEPQGFSYFVSLYYAYVSLLTIGYGDYVVQSNAGKAFMVFWSLVAVPTLTILISNMGETVIKAFKDFTIWLGSLTVLPDEEGLSAALKVGWDRIKTGRWDKTYQDDSVSTSEQHTLDRLAAYAEEGEFIKEVQAEAFSDDIERDIRFYHFVLAKEIHNLIKDLASQPTKQYEYYEWRFYLRLLRQSETDPSHHRQPQSIIRHDDGGYPDIGCADGNKDQRWSWLGIRSPLMGNVSESQWLLQRLTTALEDEMLRMSSPDEKTRKTAPPISIGEWKKRGKKVSDEVKTLKDRGETEQVEEHREKQDHVR